MAAAAAAGTAPAVPPVVDSTPLRDEAPHEAAAILVAGRAVLAAETATMELLGRHGAPLRFRRGRVHRGPT